MFSKFELRSVHGDLDETVRKYANKKLGGLDRYVPRHARSSAHAEVFLKEATIKKRKNYVCEVTLQLPHQTINVKEDSLNMFAAIDIVEAKLKQQLKKYKDMHASGKLHRQIFAKFARRGLSAEA